MCQLADFLVSKVMKYDKPSLSIDEQLNQLKERGLIIENYDEARSFLERVSYYRLSAYTRFFQVDINSHTFQVNVTFQDVKELYQFDKALRMIVFNAIESIEVSVRTQIINQMSHFYGPHWYLNENLFRNRNFHSTLLNNISTLCEKKKEPFIQHYFNKYCDPAYPPGYMIFEIMSFGQLCQLYEQIISCEAFKHNQT